MRKYLCTALALVLAGCATGGGARGGAALEAGIVQIADEIEQALPAGTRIAIAAFDSPSARFSSFIMEELEGVLTKRRTLVVVSRRQMEAIRNEVDFQMSGEVSDETAARIGHAVGAQVIVSGSLTDMGDDYRLRFGAIDIESHVVQASAAATVPRDRRFAYLLPADAGAPTDAERATRYFNAGIANYEAKRYREAIADFTRVLEITKDDIDALFYRSLSYLLINDYDGVIAGYTELLRLDPNNTYAYVNRGSAYDEKGDHDHAIADYNQALRLNPNSAGAYYNRGNAYSRKGDYDRAIADYTQTIRLDPNDAGAYNNRGYAYIMKGDYARARADWEQALRLNPNNAGTRGNLEALRKDGH